MVPALERPQHIVEAIFPQVRKVSHNAKFSVGTAYVISNSTRLYERSGPLSLTDRSPGIARYYQDMVSKIHSVTKSDLLISGAHDAVPVDVEPDGGDFRLPWDLRAPF
jgi:hypothetical protein